jgi:hypothetical protein
VKIKEEENGDLRRREKKNEEENAIIKVGRYVVCRVEGGGGFAGVGDV